MNTTKKLTIFAGVNGAEKMFIKWHFIPNPALKFTIQKRS